MKNNSSDSIKKLMLPLISLTIFILMYLLFKGGYQGVYHHFMKKTIGNTGRWMNTYGPEWFVNINKNISALGGPAVFSILTIFTFCTLIITKQFKTSIEFLITVCGVVLLLYILKYTLNPNRPSDIISVFINDDLGFPSGHAASSIALYLSIAIYLGRKSIPQSIKKAVSVLALVLIILIGISRLIVGAHTPEEVVAGWCTGIFWLSLVHPVFHSSFFS